MGDVASVPGKPRAMQTGIVCPMRCDGLCASRGCRVPMRVVAGVYGGRRLRAPPGLATRPTSERVREALFDVLGRAVVGKSVLDCYAGSGALGIEALSRNARSVVFVEMALSAANTLRANLIALGIDDKATARVVRRRLERSATFLRSVSPFDLWLVDPPFALVRSGVAVRTLSAMVRSGLLASDGMVVIEFPSDQPVPAVHDLCTATVRTYGDTKLAFLSPGNASGTDSGLGERCISCILPRLDRR